MKLKLFILNGYGKGFMLPATVQQAQNSLPAQLVLIQTPQFKDDFPAQASG